MVYAEKCRIETFNSLKLHLLLLPHFKVKTLWICKYLSCHALNCWARRVSSLIIKSNLSGCAVEAAGYHISPAYTEDCTQLCVMSHVLPLHIRFAMSTEKDYTLTNHPQPDGHAVLDWRETSGVCHRSPTAYDVYHIALVNQLYINLKQTTKKTSRKHPHTSSLHSLSSALNTTQSVCC